MVKRIQRLEVSERRSVFGRLSVILVLLAFAVPSLAAAQMNPMMKEQLARIPSGESGVKSILDPMTERLELSEEQVGEVRPIIVDLVSNMESAKTKLETGETTVMKFMMEMNAEGESAATQVEQHLNETQLTEYAAMRQEQKMRMMQERRKAMQQMMQARQAAAAAAAAEEGAP